MASIRGYATATQVRAVLASLIHNAATDSVIEDHINRWEGLIDAKLSITVSGNIVGGNTFTYSASKAKHQVVNAVAVWGAALALCGPAAYSWNTLDQLVNAQNTCSYQLKYFWDVLTEKDETGAYNVLGE